MSKAGTRASAHTNRLGKERSPYLLQHAGNPVDWYPWGDEAFERARREDKPVFLSIGYSTCHWCHVMEEESFEDEAVARLMNEAFVNVKVDREERPDVDRVYMRVCQMMTGSGGWPLTVLLTPDRRPFFATTYVPKETRFGRPGMLELVPRLQGAWKTRRAEIDASAQSILHHLSEPAAKGGASALGEESLHAAFEQLSGLFDKDHGGFGRAPKFPTPHQLNFLLRYAHRTGDAWALRMVESTLAALRRGGIFDHVGFGFHRYATDAAWVVPHFEKMLYDQALLAVAYVETFQATKNRFYADTAREVLDYVVRVHRTPEGGFSSAEDADSDGEEGKFYVWKWGEVESVLGAEEARFVAHSFHVKEEGNFAAEAGAAATGDNILHLTESPTEIAARMGVTEAAWRERWEAARRNLFLVRERRVHPFRDDKVLTDWNGLMITAFARASQAMDDAAYAQIGRNAADFVLTRMRGPEGRLLHRYRAGEAAVPGFLDDYAFFTQGLLDLYEATFEERFLAAAVELQADTLRLFWDEDAGGFFFTASDHEGVLLRDKEIYDGAVPSGNSVAFLNLLRLGRMTGDAALESKAQRLSDAFASDVARGPAGHTQFLCGLDFALGPSHEIVLVGDPGAEGTHALLQEVRTRFLPNKVVLMPSPLAPFTRELKPLRGRSTVFVCKNFQCDLPVDDRADLARRLDGA